MDLDTFRQETFASPLAAAAQGCTSGFRRHPGAKTKLPLARPLRRLVGAFHKIGSVGRERVPGRASESIEFPKKFRRQLGGTLPPKTIQQNAEAHANPKSHPKVADKIRIPHECDTQNHRHHQPRPLAENKRPHSNRAEKNRRKKAPRCRERGEQVFQCEWSREGEPPVTSTPGGTENPCIPRRLALTKW